jgi:hypothetical protein
VGHEGYYAVAGRLADPDYHRALPDWNLVKNSRMFAAVFRRGML